MGVINKKTVRISEPGVVVIKIEAMSSSVEDTTLLWTMAEMKDLFVAQHVAVVRRRKGYDAELVHLARQGAEYLGREQAACAVVA